jgi:golgi-specific brefeldin A-resistance guanine nucleotide exchange factor 1
MDKIKILLYNLKSTNKEFKDIINESTVYTTPCTLFGAIFSINSYTNTDMYNYLSIYEMFTIENSGDIIQKIVNLKFFPSEKDTDQVILKYFSVLNKLDIQDREMLNLIYSRYIILLNSTLFASAISNEIFNNLVMFLNKNPSFLDRSIILLKDQAYRYRLLLDTTDIRHIFIVPSITLVVLHNTKSKYIVQEYFEDIPKWYFDTLSDNILEFLYYNFDRHEIYRDVSFMYFKRLNIQEIADHVKINILQNNVIEENDERNNKDKDSKKNGIIKDEGESDKHILNSEFTKKINIQNYGSINLFIDDTCHIHWKSESKEYSLSKLIESFNKTKDITDLYMKYQENTFLLLRYHENTNLRSLGEFLCSHKNIKYLSEFTNTFDFTDTNLLICMRSYLSGFYLVGESQIIHRVLSEFSSKYCIDNKIDDSSFILNMSFSLLLLNTKMYNPSVKSKPSFEEYIKDFDTEEIPEYMNKDAIREMYNSIKNVKLDLPTKNQTSEGHYKVYNEILRRFNLKDEMLSDEVFTSHEQISNNSIHRNDNLYIYLMDKLLFDNPSLLNTPHDKFYEVCKYISTEYIPIYLVYNKDDTYRFLNMFKYYMSYPGDIRIYKIFMNTAKRIENNNKISYILNRLKRKDNVLPQYKGIYTDIINKDIHPKNIKIIEECIKITTCDFLNNLFVLILEFNIQKVDNINYLDYDTQLYLVERSVSVNLDYLRLICTSQYKMKLLRQCIENNPRLINHRVIEVFKAFDDKSEDGFYTMILLQREEDMFDYVIEIYNKRNDGGDGICNKRNEEIYNKRNEGICNKRNEGNEGICNKRNEGICNKRNEEIYNEELYNKRNEGICNKKGFSERYPINNNTALFYFYSSSKYILNQSKLKGILKGGCIRNHSMMSQSILDNRLIYLILKCNELDNKENINYSLWIINLISSSIPIFIRFFTEYIDILEGSILRISIMKIFISRLKKVVSGMYMCCDCKYNKIGIVDIFINDIVERDLISMEDIEFWFVWKKEMCKDKRIEEEEGEYVIKY